MHVVLLFLAVIFSAQNLWAVDSIGSANAAITVLRNQQMADAATNLLQPEFTVESVYSSTSVEAEWCALNPSPIQVQSIKKGIASAFYSCLIPLQNQKTSAVL